MSNPTQKTEPNCDDGRDNNASAQRYTRAAAAGTLATLAFRLLSFGATQWTLRSLSHNVAALGRAAVPLELLLTTVLFVSREGFRLALTGGSGISDERGNKNDKAEGASMSAQQWANVAWLVVPVGTLLSAVAAVWFHVSNGSNNDNDDSDFAMAGFLYCGACCMELWGEPAALYALKELKVVRKVTAESMATLGKTVALVVLLQLWGEDGPVVTAFGWAQVTYAMFYTGLLYAQSWWELPLPRYFSKQQSPPKPVLHRRTCVLTLWFTLQGIFKHLLTEGDRIVLTALSDSYNQGVYAMGSSYGGMAARILFQPLEENCRLLWSRLSTEPSQKQQQQEPSALQRSYTTVVKGVLYVGLVFSCLAVNYTELLLNLLAGRTWGNNPEAVQVLSAFCVYTACLAWNGTTEAFVYATARSGADVGRLGVAHTIVGLLFGLSAPWAVRRYGTVGLVAMNGCSMLLRSLYSLHSAAQYFETSVWRLLPHMVPHPGVGLAFGLSYLATRQSLTKQRDSAVSQGILVGSLEWFQLSLSHVGVGVACGVGVLSLAYVLEREFRRNIHAQLRSRSGIQKNGRGIKGGKED